MKTRKVIRNIQKWMMQTMALTAVFLAGSCNNEEFAEENGRIATNGKTPISFRMQNGAGAQLRATSTTNKTIGAFVVNAIDRDDDAEWITSGAVVGEGKISRFVLNGVTVSHKETGASGEEWSYYPEAFFPEGKNSDSIEFFAYSPVNPVGLTNGLKDDVQNNGADRGPSITYEVPEVDKDGKTNQQDLLVAYAVVKPGSGGNGSVDADYSNITSVKLKFRHALSRVLVQAKKTNLNAEIIIDSIKLNNLKYKGTLNLKGNTATASEKSNGIPWSVTGTNSEPTEWKYPAPRANTSTSTDSLTLWKLENDIKTFNYHLQASGIVVPLAAADGTGAKLVTGPEQGMYVMPQAVSADNATTADVDEDFGLEVVYRVNNATRRAQFIFADTIATEGGDFKAVPIAFEIGRQYVMEINFTDKTVGAKIIFNTEMDEFDTKAPVIPDRVGPLEQSAPAAAPEEWKWIISKNKPNKNNQNNALFGRVCHNTHTLLLTSVRGPR
jgi:hypothetical protein